MKLPLCFPDIPFQDNLITESTCRSHTRAANVAWLYIKHSYHDIKGTDKINTVSFSQTDLHKYTIFAGVALKIMLQCRNRWDFNLSLALVWWRTPIGDPVDSDLPIPFEIVAPTVLSMMAYQHVMNIDSFSPILPVHTLKSPPEDNKMLGVDCHPRTTYYHLLRSSRFHWGMDNSSDLRKFRTTFRYNAELYVDHEQNDNMPTRKYHSRL